MCNVLDGNEIIIQIESIKLLVNFKLNMSLIKELVRINFGPLGPNIYLQYFIKFSKITTKKRKKHRERKKIYYCRYMSLNRL